jgi:hypothetical protein
MHKIMITPHAYAAIVGRMPRRDELDHTGKIGLWLSPEVAQDLRRQRLPHEDYSAAIIRLAERIRSAPV